MKKDETTSAAASSWSRSRQPLLLQTEIIKVREPFVDVFAVVESPQNGPEQWDDNDKQAYLNSKSATSGILNPDLGSAVPTTTASTHTSDSRFKDSSTGGGGGGSSSRPPRFTRGLNHSALTSKAPVCESLATTPHQFLGKDLVSLLDGCQSPLNEITDFNASASAKSVKETSSAATNPQSSACQSSPTTTTTC
jgi:hypothetical protein